MGRVTSTSRLGAVRNRVAEGRLLGKSNERFILEHVQNTLAARIEDVA